MTIVAKSALAAIGALALAAPAFAQPGGAVPDCFLTRDVRNHTVGDDHTMFIDVGGRAVYRVDMSNNCFAGSTSSDPYVLRDRAGMGRICHILDFDVAVRGNRCIVAGMTKLTPAEVAALPRKLRP
ncbi:MAG: hypothetical protein ACXWKM_11725 [Phenylobacterium sp.]